MSGNTGAIPAGRAVAGITHAEQMAAYDMLPKSLRKLLSEGPLNYDCTGLVEQLREFSDQFGGGPTGRLIALEIAEEKLKLRMRLDSANW